MSSINPSPHLTRASLEPWLPDLGFARFGLAALTTPLSMSFYDAWIENGHHGEMTYLVRHREKKSDPQKWLPFARSALVFAIDYVTGIAPQDAGSLRTALYTRFAPAQADYHDVIRRKLQPVVDELKRRHPGAEFRISIDAEPLLERDLAVRAGLGWVGKNTCVIDRKSGSLFFLAEILTSIPVETAEVVSPDHCGTCTRCLDACPTGALREPRVLDARLCISYWTIESKASPPKELRTRLGDWFYGCDICQTVCPWNVKFHGSERMDHETSGPGQATANRLQLVHELRLVLASSNSQLEKRFATTPLARARGFGLKRNAIVVAANMGLEELKPELEDLATHEKLGELAQWALSTI